MRILSGAAAAAFVRDWRDKPPRSHRDVDKIAATIVQAVRRKGENALRAYTAKLDGLGRRQPLRVPQTELRRAWKTASPDLKRALQFAAENIRRYAAWQKPKSWRRQIRRGVTVGQVVQPLDSVGCYVPAGRYPLPSTLLMTAIPAQVAGVPRIVVVSPRPAFETLAAAGMLGLEEFYSVGGAQAIAALAYGTDSIAPVVKIVGPGNAYVTAAKKLVSGDCAIDMLAGPTEALIYSEQSANAAFLASDLVAQAEHDPATRVVFITTTQRTARAVQTEVERLARKNIIARESLRKNGAILVCRNHREAITAINEMAAEHVTVVSPRDLSQIRNAGSLFVGPWSAQPIGDYCAGPNHVLPTIGGARSRGGLSVNDFVKVVTVQQLSREGVRTVSSSAIALARAEGLFAHAEAVEQRAKLSRKASHA